MKTAPKGLGHWRCGQCGKVCKVSAQKPVPREAKNSPVMPNLNLDGVTSGRTQSTAPNQSAVPREEKNSPAMAPIETTFIPAVLEALAVAGSFPVPPPGVIARIVTFGGPDAKV
jgi:hypothetical protein